MYPNDLKKLIRILGSELPLLHELEGTPQDTEWHAEGNVGIHTQMVLDALEPDSGDVLTLAAALHDIAKPICTRQAEIQGVLRVVSPRHEDMGRSYLMRRLHSVPCIQEVADLVGLHLYPKLWVKKEQGLPEYRRLARQCDLQMLTRLELADVRGRVCPDQKEAIEAVEMFGLFAEEYEVAGWDRTWASLFQERFPDLSPGALDLAYGEAIRAAESGKVTYAEESLFFGHSVAEHPPELVVLMGVSGSGKSSYIEKHFSDWEVVSMDQIRLQLTGDRTDQSMNGQVLQAAKEQLRECLRKKKRVVWDATCLRKDYRIQILGLGFDYKALTTLICFVPDEKTLFRRNNERKYPLPLQALEKQLTSLEWPWLDEAHRVRVCNLKGETLSEHGWCRCV